MPVMDEFKEERAALKQAGLKVKLIYFWDYYRWYVIAALIIIGVIISQVKFYMEKKDVVFHAGLLNASEVVVSMEDGAHTNEFAVYTGIDTENEEILFDNSMSIGPGMADSYNSAQKLVVYLSAAEIDVMVADVSIVIQYAYQNDFMDMRNILSPEQLEQYQDRFYYIDKAKVEAISNQLSAVDYSGNGVVYPDPFDPESMEDPVPVGVRIPAQCRLTKEYYLNGSDQVCSVLVNTKHLDMSLKFIDFMCN